MRLSLLLFASIIFFLSVAIGYSKGKSPTTATGVKLICGKYTGRVKYTMVEVDAKGKKTHRDSFFSETVFIEPLGPDSIVVYDAGWIGNWHFKYDSENKYMDVFAGGIYNSTHIVTCYPLKDSISLDNYYGIYGSQNRSQTTEGLFAGKRQKTRVK